MASPNDFLAVILGGGRGQRLYPLTADRSKPAVPMAGKYRLIDIPISNCINSGLYRIFVLTQFNSVSLHRHITNAYKFDAFHTGWVELLAAEQTLQSNDWYQGTADAVRKQLGEIQATGAEHVLILAGDHLYRMDYGAMLDYHVSKGADITVGVQPVAREDAPRFGLLKRHADGRIVSFVEKPTEPEVQARMVSRDDPARPFLGSMGIYVFRTRTLVSLLREYPDLDDFGSDVIPFCISRLPVCGFGFDGYWQDIGTIRTFYDTNLLLTRPDAPFSFYDDKSPHLHPLPVPAQLQPPGQPPEGRHAERGLHHRPGGDHRLHHRAAELHRRRLLHPGQHHHGRGLLRAHRAGRASRPGHREALPHRGRHPGQERAHRRRGPHHALPRGDGHGPGQLGRPGRHRGDPRPHDAGGRHGDRAAAARVEA